MVCHTRFVHISRRRSPVANIHPWVIEGGACQTITNTTIPRPTGARSTTRRTLMPSKPLVEACWECDHSRATADPCIGKCGHPSRLTEMLMHIEYAEQNRHYMCPLSRQNFTRNGGGLRPWMRLCFPDRITNTYRTLHRIDFSVPIDAACSIEALCGITINMRHVARANDGGRRPCPRCARMLRGRQRVDAARG